MRNLPLQFLDEKTIEYIGKVRRSENVAPQASQSWMRRVWLAILSNLDGDGPRSIANFERAMRGR